jgi:hypothetical protein
MTTAAAQSNIAKGIGFTGVFGVGLFAGIWWGSTTAPINHPFDIDEARSVIAALRPLGRQDRPTDISVYLWGDGSINISVDSKAGAKFRGKGNTVAEAARDMVNQSVAVANALRTDR